MTTKTILTGVLAVVVLGLIAGGYWYPKQIEQTAGSAGAVFNTAKFAGTAASLAAPGSTGTTTSVYNGDSTNRYVTGVRLGCNNIGTSQTAYVGTGLAALTLTVGTSSTAGANTVGATAKLLNAAVVSTSSAIYSFASTTSNGVNAVATLWHPGEYMTFQFNATNTAACTIGVDYIGS